MTETFGNLPRVRQLLNGRRKTENPDLLIPKLVHPPMDQQHDLPNVTHIHNMCTTENEKELLYFWVWTSLSSLG